MENGESRGKVGPEVSYKRNVGSQEVPTAVAEEMESVGAEFSMGCKTYDLVESH